MLLFVRGESMRNKHESKERLTAFNQPLEKSQVMREKLTTEATSIAAKHGLIVSSIVFVIGTLIWRFPVNGEAQPFYPIPIIAVGMAIWCFFRSRRQLIDFAEAEIEALEKHTSNNP